METDSRFVSDDRCSALDETTPTVPAPAQPEPISQGASIQLISLARVLVAELHIVSRTIRMNRCQTMRIVAPLFGIPLASRLKSRPTPEFQKMLPACSPAYQNPDAPPSSVPADEIDPRDVPEHIKLCENELQAPCNILFSPYPEARMICQVPKTTEFINVTSEAIYDRLSNLAEEAANLDVQTAKLDPWLRAGIGQQQTRISSRNQNLPEEDKVWPHWYWMLARRGNNNIGLTTKSQMTPLLLRLSFCVFPFFNPKRDPIFPFNNQDEAIFQNASSGWGNLGANPLCIDHLSANMMSDSAHVTLQEANSHALADNARQALLMNMQCSYWLYASQCIKDQMVVWESSPTQRESDSLEPSRLKQGLILPQVTVMGTITCRATEKT
ncbi:hypothetical protein H4Q26_004074 [Puccinia striiformis f. sp. tritici PST-130]|nr:hypothetical protein H4Q26_004074 [Puccinia striiformis f. sp. tritici PST-130]